MRIVFLGSGEFGLPTLQALLGWHQVPLIVTQPDRPAGRDRRPTPTPIAQFAQQRGLNVIKPPRVNSPEIVGQITAANPDANIVVAFGQKIGDAIIASPKYGRVATMNLHASLLPKYRGAAPIHWAILSGETVTGNTVFSLVDRMDAGDILAVQTTPIKPHETTGDLHDRLARMGPELVLDTLARLERGALNPRPQDESQATLAPKLGRGDAALDFRTSAEQLRRTIHGLTPWPGVMVHYMPPDGIEPRPLKLCRVQAVEGGGPPGSMIADGVVAAGQGAIRLLEVQPPGKRLMPWSDFSRGHRLPIGSVFTSAPQG